MLDNVEQKSIIFWQEMEQAILLIRWNGNIELKQGDSSVMIGDGSDVEELIKALKACKSMTWEHV